MVHEFDLLWQQFFLRNRLKTKVLMVVYENFVAHYDRVVHRVIDHLGIGRDGVAVAPPQLLRQADQRSAEWEQLFIGIANERSAAAERRARPVPGQAVASAE